MRAPGAASETGNRPPRLRLPIRRAQANKGGNEVHSAGIGNTARQCFALRSVVDDSETIAEPLDGRSRDEYASFHRIPWLAMGTTPHSDQETLDRKRQVFAGHDQEKRPRPVGVLGQARSHAPLAEQCCLLITGYSGDWQR